MPGFSLNGSEISNVGAHTALWQILVVVKLVAMMQSQ